jgi:hypothetical protein
MMSCISGEQGGPVKAFTLGETGTEQTRNLLDKRLGGQESVVLLGELLDELLVLVESTEVIFQIVDRRVLKFDLLGTIDVSCIGENAYGHAGARNVGESGWMKRY